MEVVSGAMRRVTACSPDAGWLLDNRPRLPRSSWRTHSEAKGCGRAATLAVEWLSGLLPARAQCDSAAWLSARCAAAPLSLNQTLKRVTAAQMPRLTLILPHPSEIRQPSVCEILHPRASGVKPLAQLFRASEPQCFVRLLSSHQQSDLWDCFIPRLHHGCGLHR